MQNPLTRQQVRVLSIMVGYFVAMSSLTGYATDLKREYVSASLLGSGNAGVTDLFGIDSLFYNPANLARTEKILGDIILVSPQIEASQNGVELYKDIKANKNMLEVVGKAAGRPISVAVQNATGASFRRTAFGLFQRADLDVGVKNDPFSGIPLATATSSACAGVAMGFGRSFARGLLHFGLTGLVVQKAEAKLEVSALDAQTKLGQSGGKSSLSDALKRGVGVGAHTSLMFTPGGSSSPEFVLVARNLGMSYGVGGKSASQRPSAEIQTIDFGFSVQPGTKNSRSRLSIDLDDIMNKSQQNIYKRLHLGAEVTFTDILGVLGGLNQGYSTYGLYINAKIIRIDAGIFAREMGKYPGDSKNRSYYGRVTMGWAK